MVEDTNVLLLQEVTVIAFSDWYKEHFDYQGRTGKSWVEEVEVDGYWAAITSKEFITHVFLSESLKHHTFFSPCHVSFVSRKLCVLILINYIVIKSLPHQLYFLPTFSLPPCDLLFGLSLEKNKPFFCNKMMSLFPPNQLPVIPTMSSGRNG